MAPVDPREESSDPMDVLVWLVERGYAVAIRGVYNRTRFNVRAVRGETTLLAEDRELGAALRSLRSDAQKNAKAERG